MGVYFGTDGFRGIYGESLSPGIAYKIGNSLSRLCNKTQKVVLGRDTRRTGSLLSLSVAGGLMANGIDVIDAGILPTPAIAFLTKKYGFDYGIVISASHNPKDYNGIKIFDREGYKISEEEEDEIERHILCHTQKKHGEVGRYCFSNKLKKDYKKVISILNRRKPLNGN